MIEKYNTYEIYKCKDCGAYVKIPFHNRDILPDGHNWIRRISKEKEVGVVKDPLKEAII
jgi:hypothetical protein